MGRGQGEGVFIVPHQSPEQTNKSRRLRRELTGPERRLWSALRSRRCAKLKVRRQHPIGPYVVDFVSLEHCLVVELDGDSHNGSAVYDRERQSQLESAGYRVLRVGNDDVLNDLDAVLGAILQACGIRE
jgi:very-short-patch-repair endonuclease